ncbi:MAG: TIGR03905 family TSCPD domain-containing protein [Clostridia bacterium]|nr:TIGR03905 family TSCPD domain-containing protein [Clostridia bacterium]
MEFTYTPKGVCARSITIKLSDDNTIEDVSFYGGCNGNLKGISSLVKGMELQDVIEKLE